jgi:hypothetical protein
MVQRDAGAREISKKLVTKRSSRNNLADFHGGVRSAEEAGQKPGCRAEALTPQAVEMEIGMVIS